MGMKGLAQLSPKTVTTAAGHGYLVIEAPASGVQVSTASGVGCGPSEDDERVLLSVAAAFTGDDLRTVCGTHVVHGTVLPGYDDVTATGHLLLLPGGRASIMPNSELAGSIAQAQAQGGCLFQQCHIVEGGVARPDRIPRAILDRKAHIIYRAAVIMADGTLAVVQGTDRQYPAEFVAGLVQLGAVEALYLDMGTWAWGWWREQAGAARHELAERFDNTKYQSNWLVFTAE